MTSFGTLKSAVDAMKQGAVDYISKPFDHDEMLMSVSRILREQKLSNENEALKQTVTVPETGIIGNSPSMQELFRRISKVAPCPLPCWCAVSPAPARNWWPAPCISKAPAATAR